MSRPRVFKYRLKTDADVLAAAAQIMESKINNGEAFTNVESAKRYFRFRLAGLEHEVFSVMYLTAQHQFICCEDPFRGTIDGAFVYPREIVKDALKHNANAVFIAHNHPSGVPEPSAADRNITKILKDTLHHIDVRLLDHFVVTPGSVVSFAERGLI